QYPLKACRSYFPGQKVIPTRPNSGPAVTTAICKGWVKDVFFIYNSKRCCFERRLNQPHAQRLPMASIKRHFKKCHAVGRRLTLSGCNTCRFRASRPGTNRFWG